MGVNTTKLRIVVFGEQGDYEDDAEVLFDGSTLTVDQEYDIGQHAIYKGKMQGDWHFRVLTKDGDEGTLHRIPGTDLLEGHWSDADGSEGYWCAGPVRGLGATKPSRK